MIQYSSYSSQPSFLPFLKFVGYTSSLGYLPEQHPRLIPSSVFYFLPNKGFDPERYSGSKIPVLSFWKRNLGGNFKKEPLSPDSLAIRDSKKKFVELVLGGRFELGGVLVPEDPFAIQSLE